MKPSHNSCIVRAAVKQAHAGSARKDLTISNERIAGVTRETGQSFYFFLFYVFNRGNSTQHADTPLYCCVSNEILLLVHLHVCTLCSQLTCIVDKFWQGSVVTNQTQPLQVKWNCKSVVLFLPLGE